jgi:hypothetical protein
MKTCPQCKSSFAAPVSDNIAAHDDEIMQELIERQKTSDLCLDCLLEEWVAETGKAQLRKRA